MFSRFRKKLAYSLLFITGFVLSWNGISHKAHTTTATNTDNKINTNATRNKGVTITAACKPLDSQGTQEENSENEIFFLSCGGIY